MSSIRRIIRLFRHKVYIIYIVFDNEELYNFIFGLIFAPYFAMNIPFIISSNQITLYLNDIFNSISSITLA